MNSKFNAAADTVLDYTVNRFGGAPGVVAMATERRANVYEGAVGKRELGKDQPMTTDSVFAIFSTTKAVTGRDRHAAGRGRQDQPVGPGEEVRAGHR
jgi:methyl acetate hydrolase